MLPALIVGALTAWYLGLRVGAVVAVATAVALLVATFVPGMSVTIYALVIAWCAALYFFGPKISKASGKSSMSSVFGSPLGQAKAWATKLWKTSK
ncbi:MAG TPA: hypothetical protein VIV40_06790 [Kofleriaceae bacterium]